MNRDGALRPAPEDLGQAADIDSFAVEPGVIVLDRFCALDRVQRSAQGWSVPVTDVERQLGHSPHHRLNMEFLRVDEPAERKLRRAVRLMADVQPVVHGWIRARDGMLLLTDPVGSLAIVGPLAEPEAAHVAIELTATLSQLHGAGVTGVAFAPESLHLVGRDVKVVGYGHLLTAGTAEEDVHRLADLLELLSGGALSAVLRPTPTTAVELWDRMRSLQSGASARRFALPATPPFVGREEILARLMDSARRARNGAAQIVVLRAESGMGRTRLLQRFAAEVDPPIEAVVLSGSFKAGAPNTRGGLVEILDALAQQPSSLTTSDHDAILERVRGAAGPLVGMVAGLSPALGQWLGYADIPANMQLHERYGQHAATIAAALRAVGTARRPLILLLDDVHLADPGSVAVLHEFLNTPRQHHTMLLLASDRAEGRDWEKLASVVVDLPPLGRTDLRDLLLRSVPGELADPDGHTDHLWRVSAGRPSVAWATLQRWTSEAAWILDEATGSWRLSPEQSDALPPADALGDRWRTLQPHQQWIVLVSALRAGRTTIPWLAAVTVWNETEVRNSVQTAIDAGILIAEPDGGLRFVNEAVRTMVEQGVNEDVRTSAHRQIADWLDREPGASVSQRAWHRDLARPAGRDEYLAELHVKGAQELLAIYDLGRARWHFDRALARATSPAIWVDALEGRADVALLDGRTDNALDDYLQAMTYGGDPIRGLEIAGKAVHGFYRKSAPAAAYELASRALELAREPMPTSTLALAWAVITSMLTLRLRSPAASTRVRDALCRLYTYMTVMLIADRPAAGLLCILRGVRHARGLDSENAAAVLSFYSVIWAAAGRTHLADRLINDAEAVARRAGQPWGLGVVHHMRAQNEMAVGQYEQAGQSFDKAVDQFRLAGDLSVAVFSLSLRAVYGREHQPVERLLEWCEEAETCARRQGNRLGLIAVSALRAYARARRHDPEALDLALSISDEVRAVPTSSIDLVTTHSFLSLAFVMLGNLDRAWEHARAASTILDNGPAAADYLLDAHVATCATVLAIASPTSEQQKALNKALRALKRYGRTSPRLGAAWRLYAARNALRSGSVEPAMRQLTEVIATHGTHRQSAYVLEAHEILAERLQHGHPDQAANHRAEAQAIGVSLGLVAPPRAPEAPPVPRIDPQPAAPPTWATEQARSQSPAKGELPIVQVEPTVRRLLPAFERALPPRVTLAVDIAEDAQVRCNPESLQLLVVNLVLAARDALREHGRIMLSVAPVKLDQADSARLPGLNTEAHLLVEVRAIGYHASDTISGLGVCSEITSSIGGFVDVRHEPPDVLVLAAYLSAAHGEPRDAEAPAAAADQAVVIHSDPRIRQTVVSALRDLGLRAEGIDPSLHLDRRAGDARLVFAESPWFLDQPPHRETSREVVLYGRGSSPPSGRALRVPFTMGELQDVVDALTGPDSNG